MLAFAGYVATYLNGLYLSKRQAKLERVNQQLRDLYGPLYALSQAEGRSWRAFRRQHRPKGIYWDPKSPPSESEAKAWRTYITEVCMPLYQNMEKTYLKHSDLLREETMPSQLMELSAHIAGYRIVTSQWKEGDYSNHLSYFNYPGEKIREYAKRGYLELKAEQAKLLR